MIKRRTIQRSGGLPAGHQDEFKPVERGFVRNETIDNKNTAEHIAHIRECVERGAQEKIGIAVDDIERHATS